MKSWVVLSEARTGVVCGDLDTGFNWDGFPLKNKGFTSVVHWFMDFKNPVPTVDIIIEQSDGIILIERMNPPHGWALLGGFVDYGESLESAARREALEETGLVVNLLGQFHTYSDPDRDSRQHNISTVYVGQATGKAQAGSDA